MGVYEKKGGWGVRGTRRVGGVDGDCAPKRNADWFVWEKEGGNDGMRLFGEFGDWLV